MVPPPIQTQIAGLILDAFRIWRQPLPAKAGALVVYVGLGLLVPGIRDLLLVAIPLLINWALEKSGSAWRFPPMDAVPWWIGLILIGGGLLFLLLHVRQRIVIITVKITKDGITIRAKGPADMVDNPALPRLFETVIKTRAPSATPPVVLPLNPPEPPQ